MGGEQNKGSVNSYLLGADDENIVGLDAGVLRASQFPSLPNKERSSGDARPSPASDSDTDANALTGHAEEQQLIAKNQRQRETYAEEQQRLLAAQVAAQEQQRQAAVATKRQQQEEKQQQERQQQAATDKTDLSIDAPEDNNTKSAASKTLTNLQGLLIRMAKNGPLIARFGMLLYEIYKAVTPLIENKKASQVNQSDFGKLLKENTDAFVKSKQENGDNSSLSDDERRQIFEDTLKQMAKSDTQKNTQQKAQQEIVDQRVAEFTEQNLQGKPQPISVEQLNAAFTQAENAVAIQNEFAKVLTQAGANPTTKEELHDAIHEALDKAGVGQNAEQRDALAANIVEQIPANFAALSQESLTKTCGDAANVVLANPNQNAALDLAPNNRSMTQVAARSYNFTDTQGKPIKFTQEADEVMKPLGLGAA